jgi:phosphoribosylformylglycinamidine synthase
MSGGRLLCLAALSPGEVVRFGIVIFPGSNCDHDVYHVVKHVVGADARFIWHKDRTLDGIDVVVLPGGFAHGDYLRTGALARHSPVMEEVTRFARRGGPVLGICNGFQILLEAGLLPGAMVRNRGLKFICRDVDLRREGRPTRFTKGVPERLRLPIAHAEGNYVADPETLDRLEGEGRVVFRYCDREGRPSDAANPNGSARNIAGIASDTGNVVGLMPHPERSSEAILGDADGRTIFEAALAHA